MSRRKSAQYGKLADLSAAALAKLLAEGTVRAEETVEAHLERIAEHEETVQAWAHLDPDFAREQARALDKYRAAGRPIGPLHGVPVGVKDIVDVRGLPCECGTPLEAGRRPRRDATVVSRLRQAGAVILGKTVTTELAVYHPGKTRNPRDPERTPGGSSSGSAAAVAAGMAPLALGTQTNGSVIRPASYCGIVGFKPTHGLVSRHGVLAQSPPLDTVGAMARDVADAGLFVDALAGFDENDKATRPEAQPGLHAMAQTPVPVRPTLALARTSVWDKADADMAEGFAELAAALGGTIDEIELPAPFDRAIDLHRAIQVADIAKNYGAYYNNGADRLSDMMRGLIEEGRGILAVDYALAHDWIEVLNAGLEEIFDRYDAIVTPAATGEAPLGLESTGSPDFCTLWTFCGVPAVTVPLLTGANDMPIGVQLVGRRGNDGRLLRTANWLIETLQADAAVSESA